MTASRPLLDLLKIELPIIQAPMAGTSSPAMAAAVSGAGGLGSLGLGAFDVENSRAAIREARARGAGPLNVNLFVHKPAQPDAALECAWIERLRPEFVRLGVTPPTQLTEVYKTSLDNAAMLEMLLAERPAVVSLHFGLLGETSIRALRAAGIVLFVSVTSLAEAKLAAGAGAHALVAQGWEAGGHRGIFEPEGADDRLGTLALIRLLARGTDLPVIAAGGIMDGAGIDAALALGAAAAQLGTAFVATEESLADESYRAALFSEAARHTVMTPVISGRPARCLANRFTAFGMEVNPAEVPAYPIAYDMGKALNAAGKKAGEAGFGAQWAGQGAPLARRMPAAELVRTLAQEMKAR